jgi:hypothetical protein
VGAVCPPELVKGLIAINQAPSCRTNFAKYSASTGDKLNLKQASSISFAGFLSGPYFRSSEIHLTAFLKFSPSDCMVVMVNILCLNFPFVFHHGRTRKVTEKEIKLEVFFSFPPQAV